MKIGHIAIRIEDVDKSLDFYCYGLGFKEAFRINNDDGGLRIVYVHISQGQYLELCLGGNDKSNFDDKVTLGVRHICFVVDNIEKFKKDTESHGIVYDSKIMKMKDNNLAAYLFDPDGNKIEIVQTDPDSPHAKFENTLNQKG